MLWGVQMNRGVGIGARDKQHQTPPPPPKLIQEHDSWPSSSANQESELRTTYTVLHPLWEESEEEEETEEGEEEEEKEEERVPPKHCWIMFTECAQKTFLYSAWIRQMNVT